MAVAAEQQQTYESVYYDELVRCVHSVYSSLESSCVADYKNAFIKYVSDRTTGVVEDMFSRHCKGLCSCRCDVFVAKGPNCWIDGVKYVSYDEYLREVGHSSYYVRVQEFVVAEVVELSPECYRWSSHPVRRDPRECSANGGPCRCNVKITRLTVSYVINDSFLLRRPLLRCQQHIVRGGENMLRNLDTGDIIEHFNDRPSANHYRMMLATRFVPVFQKRIYERMSEWVLKCKDESHLPPSLSSEEDDDDGQEQ